MLKAKLSIFLFFIMSLTMMAEFSTVEPATIKVDGQFGDWKKAGLKPVYTDLGAASQGVLSGLDIKEFALAEDGNYLYLYMAYKGNAKSFVEENFGGDSLVQIFFNSDLNPKTGATDYLVYDQDDVHLKEGFDSLLEIGIKENKKGEPRAYFDVRVSTKPDTFGARVGKVKFAGSSPLIASSNTAIELSIPLQSLKIKSGNNPVVPVVITEHSNADLESGVIKTSLDFEKTRASFNKANSLNPMVYVVLVVLVLWVGIWFLIFKKTGLSAGMAMAMIFPPLGFFLLTQKTWPMHLQKDDLKDELYNLEEEV